MLDALKNIQKINFDDIYNIFLGLERRQQALAVLVLLLAIGFMLWAPAYFINLNISKIENDYKTHLKDAQKLKKILFEYADLQKSIGQNQGASGSEDNLANLIYSKAEEFGIPKKKVSLKTMTALPSGDLFESEGKEVEIKSVPLDQILRLLSGLESSTDMPLVIKKLNLKADKKNRQVISEADMSIITLKARKS